MTEAAPVAGPGPAAVPDELGAAPVPARRRRRLRALGVTALVGGVGVAAGAAALGIVGQDQDQPARSTAPPAVAEVVRQTLTESEDVDGTLGYGDAVDVPGRGPGTVTSAAAEGSVVRRGQRLFAVDARPVVLLYGSSPLYRTLSAGMDGADVAVLERNLRALGYTGFDVDDEYTSATAAAVEQWQDDLGVDGTGRVDPAGVVVAAGAVRVAEQKVPVGGSTAAGQAVLTYTGTTRRVIVDLPVDQQQLARRGAAVTVDIPGGGTVRGTVASIGSVASSDDSDDEDAPPGAEDPAADATLEVVVRVADQRRLGRLDGAPVTVTFVASQRRNVLAVPVHALLALAEGGYGVQVVAGATTRIVAVETGLFASGQVEISGAGIDAGTKIGVPAS